MFCPNCRANLPDGTTFCTNCGYNLAASAPVNPVPTAPVASAPTAPVGGPAFGGGAGFGGNPFKNSTWDGSVVDTVINSIIASVIVSCTCAIATPWALCYILRFVISHTIIDGKRLKFDGDGGALFGNWIKWMLLTVITCGIYSFWVTPRLYQWIASHIHYED